MMMRQLTFFFESYSFSVQFGFDFFGSIFSSKTLINHIMLKTIQILGCSSGLVSHRWKPQTSCCSLSFISSVSTKPLSSSSSSRTLPTTKDLVFPGPSTRRTRLGAFSMSSAHSGSNPGGPSSSSSSPSSSTVVVQSVVSFFCFLFNFILNGLTQSFDGLQSCF